MNSRPYKYDVMVVPQAWAFATPCKAGMVPNKYGGCTAAGANSAPACVDKKDGPLSGIAAGFCQAGKNLADTFGGGSNALQKNLGNALERDKKAINTVGGNLKTSYDRDMSKINAGIKKDLEGDPILQGWNGIQEGLDKFMKGGGIGGIFGEGGMMLPVIVIGGAVVLIMLLKR